MSNEMTVFVCDSLDRCAQAMQWLVTSGYAADKVSITKVQTFIYDAQKYDSGTSEERFDKYVVTATR